MLARFVVPAARRVALAVPLLAGLHLPLAAAEPGSRVAAVEFAPVSRLGPYRFAELVAVQPGGEFRPEAVERSLRLLRETGFFDAVAVDVMDAPAGAIVFFTVSPRPLVRDVRIRGNLLILEKDLLPALRLRPAEPFLEEVLAGDVSRLLRHYGDEGFSGTEVVPEVERERDTVRVVFRIREGRPEVIRDIRVEGAAGVDPGEVADALGLRRFTFFRQERLQSGLDRVRDFYQGRGYLDARVSAEVEADEGFIPLLAALFNPIKGLLALGPGGYRVVTIVLRVVEGRRYWIELAGVEQASEAAVRSRLGFAQTGFFDEAEVEAGRERILAFYHERGFYLVEVDVEADYDAGRVTYTIREGRPVAVAEVRFRGVAHFDEDWLRARLATQAGAAPGLLLAADLEADRRRIESWYREEGFPAAEVPPPEVWPEHSPEGAQVVFHVREGGRSLHGRVLFEGVSGLEPALLRELVELGEGEPYREAAVAKAVETVRAAYVRAGYARSEVAARTEFAPDGSSVDVRFTVREGPRLRLGKVVVVGNGKTRRNVILREIPLAPGDALDPDALARARVDLYALGLFREVRFLFPQQVDDGAPQDVVVAVRERPSGFVGFGVGFATDERYRGFVEVGEQNLFGTGRGVRWKSKASTIGHRHDLFYQEPRLFDRNLQGQADLYAERREEEGFEVQRRGLTFGVNRELARGWLLNGRYRYEFVDYFDVDPALVEAEGSLERIFITSLIGVLTHDRRDNPVAPRRGSYSLASVEAARPLFGGDTTFTKYRLESSWYLPLGNGAELVLAARGGFTQLPGGEAGLPLSERFYLGGDSTVRGYAYRELGPRNSAGTPVGGHVFVLGNAELRFTVRKKLRGVLFADAGELWPVRDELPSTGLRSAAGAGLRYDTLVGPVRLDWGVKLRPEEGESRSRWHLTIGYPF